jgi:hypothetical protein
MTHIICVESSIEMALITKFGTLGKNTRNRLLSVPHKLRNGVTPLHGIWITTEDIRITYMTALNHKSYGCNVGLPTLKNSRRVYVELLSLTMHVYRCYNSWKETELYQRTTPRREMRADFHASGVIKNMRLLCFTSRRPYLFISLIIYIVW